MVEFGDGWNTLFVDVAPLPLPYKLPEAQRQAVPLPLLCAFKAEELLKRCPPSGGGGGGGTPVAAVHEKVAHLFAELFPPPLPNRSGLLP